jgi:hypothetical protein
LEIGNLTPLDVGHEVENVVLRELVVVEVQLIKGAKLYVFEEAETGTYQIAP